MTETQPTIPNEYTSFTRDKIRNYLIISEEIPEKLISLPLSEKWHLSHSIETEKKIEQLKVNESKNFIPNYVQFIIFAFLALIWILAIWSVIKDGRWGSLIPLFLITAVLYFLLVYFPKLFLFNLRDHLPSTIILPEKSLHSRLDSEGEFYYSLGDRQVVIKGRLPNAQIENYSRNDFTSITIYHLRQTHKEMKWISDRGINKEQSKTSSQDYLTVALVHKDPQLNLYVYSLKKRNGFFKKPFGIISKEELAVLKWAKSLSLKVGLPYQEKKDTITFEELP